MMMVFKQRERGSVDSDETRTNAQREHLLALRLTSLKVAGLRYPAVLCTFRVWAVAIMAPTS